MLPSPQQSLLLQGCLGTKQVAATAWSDWLSQVRDPRSVFEKDLTGLKGLLPFIRHSLETNGIKVSDEFRVYLQVSSVREELRSNIYRKILAGTLLALRSAHCDVIALRAAALSETVYEKESIRHNHAIELLVQPSHMQNAVNALRQLPFQRQEHQRAWQRDLHPYIHETGLPLVLHTRLLLLPYYPVNLSETWTSSRQAILSGVETKILSPSETLVHICGHASYSRSRANLRWVCDAVLTLRHYPDMNWNRVLEQAQQYRLTLPLWIMLEYLARRLHAPIPEEVLAELSCAAAGMDRISREAAIVGTMLGATSPSSAIRGLRGNPRAQMLFIRLFLLPSRTYMCWRYGIEHRWLLPFAHLYRLMKFGALAAVRLTRKQSARAREELVADVD